MLCAAHMHMLSERPTMVCAARRQIRWLLRRRTTFEFWHELCVRLCLCVFPCRCVFCVSVCVALSPCLCVSGFLCLCTFLCLGVLVSRCLGVSPVRSPLHILVCGGSGSWVLITQLVRSCFSLRTNQASMSNQGTTWCSLLPSTWRCMPRTILHAC